MSHQDSYGEHLCSGSVSGGFLRPSFEEILAYNRSISVGEEEKGGVVGSCKWGSGLLKSRLRFLTSKNHKQDYKQRGTTTWG